MPYALYGKWTVSHMGNDGKMVGPNTQFRPLDRRGNRQRSIQDAMLFDTRQQAKEVLSKIIQKDGTEIEIRKVKDIA